MNISLTTLMTPSTMHGALAQPVLLLQLVKLIVDDVDVDANALASSLMDTHVVLLQYGEIEHNDISVALGQVGQLQHDNLEVGAGIVAFKFSLSLVCGLVNALTTLARKTHTAKNYVRT